MFSKTHVGCLQCVQDCLARVVISSFTKHDHIQGVLEELDWLPVDKGIDSKKANMTFKFLESDQRTYLSELLHRHVPVSSKGKSLLIIPIIKSANGTRSFSLLPLRSGTLFWNIQNWSASAFFRKQICSPGELLPLKITCTANNKI